MNPILRTVLQRLMLGVLTMFVVSILIFAVIAILPGDFATVTLGQAATPESVAAFQRQLGLDQPAVIRYFRWISNLLRGDFGTTFAGASGAAGIGSRAVISVVAPRLENTLFLAVVTAAIAVPLGLALGMLAALYRDSVFDRVVNLATLTSISVPEFFVAYVLLLFLSIKLPLFYSLATVSSDTPLAERLVRCALPALTLSFAVVAHMMRMTRAVIIGLLAHPYIEMARLKGLSPARVIYRHALPNAWAPIAAVLSLNLAYLIVGVVVVEVVFVYPGVGQLMVDAVSNRDIPVVQACALIFAVAYIGLNLAADIISIITNPRLLHSR